MIGLSEFEALRAYFDAHQSAKNCITVEKFSEAMAAANRAEQSIRSIRNRQAEGIDHDAGALPPLPKATGTIRLPGGFVLASEGYTADQMRAYALSAVNESMTRAD